MAQYIHKQYIWVLWSSIIPWMIVIEIIYKFSGRISWYMRLGACGSILNRLWIYNEHDHEGQYSYLPK